MSTTLTRDDATLHRLVQQLGDHLLKNLFGSLAEPESLNLMVRAYTQLYATELRAESLKLDLAREERESGRQFLKYYQNQKARDLAEANFDNSEKIDELGQLIFGELWSGIEETSGDRRLP